MKKDNFRAVFWGLGYIGFSGLYYYSKEHIECFGIDVNPAIEELIKTNQYKPDLMSWLGISSSSVLSSGYCRICDVTDLPHDKKELVHHICIPTEKDGKPDMEPLQTVLHSIVEFELLSKRDIVSVIIESTLIPGTAQKALKYLEQNLPNKTIYFVVSPRRDWFVCSEMDLKKLHRVYGANTEKAAEYLGKELSFICDNLVGASDYIHAEATKSIENAFRHVDITLANQLSDAFPMLDMREILCLVGTKWNINTYVPSFGTGGYCIPLSSQYLIAATNKPIGILEETVLFDTERPLLIAKKIMMRSPKKVGILGITYKEDIKVDKNCPINRIITHLVNANIDVYVNDLCFTKKEVLGKYSVYWFDFHDYAIYSEFDTLIVFVAHKGYYTLDSKKMIEMLKHDVCVYDNTGLLEELGIAQALGERYYLIGRGNSCFC